MYLGIRLHVITDKKQIYITTANYVLDCLIRLSERGSLCLLSTSLPRHWTLTDLFPSTVILVLHRSNWDV